MNSPNNQDALRALRERAEKRRLVTASLPADTPADTQRLVQELQVHQIELEMQYEELLLAQTETESIRAQYFDLYNFAPVGYCTVERNGTLMQLNLRMAQLLGEVRRQLHGRLLALFVDMAERSRFYEFMEQMWAAPGERRTCEVAMHQHDGTLFYAQLEGVATTEAEAGYQPATCRLVLLDITARRLAAAELAASQARFRASFEQSRDGMVLLEDHRFVDMNVAALRLLGCATKGEAVGHHLAEFWPEFQPNGRRSMDMLTRCLGQATANGWCRLEWARPGPGGQLQWDEMSFNPVLVQGKPLMHAAWRDVTERKHSEQRLHDSEAHLHRALAATQTGVWSWDLATGQLEQDARAQEIFALSQPVLPFASLQAMLHPDDLACVGETLAQARTQHTAFELEHRLVRPDGSIRYVVASGQFMYHPTTNEPTSLAGLVRDVTGRQAERRELDYKRQLLSNILQKLPVLLGRVGRDHRFRELAGRGLRPLGLADNEVVGQLAAERFPQEAGHITNMLAGHNESYIASFEAEGQVNYYQTYTFFNEAQQEGIFFSLDITEPERLKEEATRQRLRQQQEVLSAILTTQEEERRRIAESLHNGVGQLLYATRLHLDALPTSEALRASQHLLSEAIKATRTISHELTPSVLETFGLAVALRELVSRIPTGRLTIDLSLRGLDSPLPLLLTTAIYRIVQELLNNVIKHAQAREVHVQIGLDGDQVYSNVEDDGVGFDPAGPAQHAGIGLAGIRTRVGLLGGTFQLQSRLGRGTSVSLQIPVPAGG